MTPPRLGIVCGMAAEARALGRWARDPRVAVAISAGRPDRAETEARCLVEAGVGTLLSWGIAGALDPALGPGALIVPDEVIGPDGIAYGLASAELAAAIAGRDLLPPATGGRAEEGGRRTAAAESNLPPPPLWGRDGEGATAIPAAGVLIAGADSVLLDPAAKAALRARTGAAAVDMESHRVAAVAAGAGLACLGVRAISDPADRALPALAADALGPDGRPRTGAVIGGLLRRPGDLPALLAAGRDSRAALAALRGVADTVIGALLRPPP
jgi:nucleoside phosphorylase